MLTEIPLNQPADIPLPLPLVVPGDLFLCCLSSFLSFLSSGSEVPGVLLFYFPAPSELPDHPLVCRPHIPPLS
nr:MAG TPA: hypothetical protein [Caudoviricetes sp.]